MKKMVFTISGMHCVSCAMNIDGELEDAGVVSSKTSFATLTTEVEFDEKKNSQEQIVEIIKKLGYSAELKK